MKRKCYFFNVGTIFDRNNKNKLHDCWNYNGFCCKSDLCNGLWCEEYGIDFNIESSEQFIKDYVINGVEGTYGYLKEVEIDLEEEIWNDIEKNLKRNYNFSKNDIKNKGFIPYEYGDIIDEFSSYWEQPDISYLKQNYKIQKDKLIIKTEKELNSETINWVNKKLYGKIFNEIEI